MSNPTIPEVPVSMVNTPKSKIDQARELLDNIKNTFFDSEEFKKLDILLGQIRMDNEVNKSELFSYIENAMKEDSGYSSFDKRDLAKMKDKWFKDYESAAMAQEQQKWEVKKDTKQETTELIDDKDRLDMLANLDGDYVLDDAVRKFVSEIDLKRALSRASEWGKNLDTVYKNIVWENPNWENAAETVQKFQEALRTSIEIIRQLTDNGNAWLDALLIGKTDAFIKNVLSRVKANGDKPLEVKVEKYDGLPPLAHNLLGALATAGVLIMSRGVVMVGHEKSEVNAEKLIEEIRKETEGTFGDQAISVFAWIKDAFMGRRLSIHFGEQKAENYKTKIFAHTREVMGLTPDTQSWDIKNLELKTAFDTAMRVAKSAWVDMKDPKNFEKIQKALVQSYIIGEGFKAEGSSWSGSIGILMLVGVHRDEVSMNARKTEASDYNKAELDVTRKELDMKVLEKLGVEEEKEEDGRWVYKIPTHIQMPGDDKKIPITLSHSPEDSIEVDMETGKYIFTSSTQRGIHFTDVWSGYVVTFTDPITKITSLESAPKIQKKKEVKQIREINEQLPEDIQNFLYYVVWHPDNKSEKEMFKPLLTALAKQDDRWIASAINTLKKWKYKTFATKLQLHIDKASTWTTYMYGNDRSRAKEKYTQTYVDKNVRTPDVVRAEERLAKELGISSGIDEKKFRMESDEKYIGQQASDIFSGQEMTISCFATPKWGLHRLDTYNGSVMMSNKNVIIEDPGYKKQIIEATFENTAKDKGLYNQTKRLNQFLKAQGRTEMITPEQYKQYLINGNIDALWVSGLQVQSGKEMKIFEGRAMISGNICLNRLHGIVYPLFSLTGVVQQADNVAIVDYSTPLNKEEADIKQTAAGVNAAWVVAKTINNGSSSNINPTNSGSSNTWSGIGWGANAGGAQP